MMSQQKLKQNKYTRGLKIALSAATIILASQAAALFRAGNDWSLVCLILVSAVFATLLFIADYIHAGIVCAAGLIATAVLSRDITAVLWAGAYIPAGWIIFRGVANAEKKITRTAITVRIAVFLGILYAALIAGSLVHEHGEISLHIIFRAAEAEIEAVAENFQSLIPVDMSEPDEALRASQTELVMQMFTMNLTAMVPMIFTLYCLIIAYFSTSLFRIIYNMLLGLRTDRILKRGDWRIRLSVISAVVMIACSVLEILISRDTLLLWIITSNIRFILVPGFCIMGVYFLFDKIYDRYNRNREIKNRFVPALILFVACVVLIFFLQYGGIGMALLTITGLYSALIGDIKKFYEKTKKLVFGDDDEED